jgi:hypothetical protein
MCCPQNLSPRKVNQICLKVKNPKCQVELGIGGVVTRKRYLAGLQIEMQILKNQNKRGRDEENL